MRDTATDKALQDKAVADYDEAAFGLFGDNVLRGQESTHLRKKEAPLHRLMVLMRAKGCTTREISNVCNCTAVNVAQILRQPWAKKHLLELITLRGNSGIDALLQGAVPESVQTLIEVRDDPDSPATAKITAADKILDRYFGKPTQRVESTVEAIPSTADVEELQGRLAKLREKEAQLRSN